MFRRKKAPSPPEKSDGGKRLMAQMGYGGAMEDMDVTSNDDDYDYEAELKALQDEDDSDAEPDQKTRPHKKGKILSPEELNKLMKMGSLELDEPEVSDTEDPDIMAELQRLTSENDDENHSRPSHKPQPSPPHQKPLPSLSDVLSLLDERAGNYKLAIQHSKQTNEASKTRRYERGLKTINSLLRDARAGKKIDPSDVPPIVAMPTQASSSSQPSSSSSQPSSSSSQPSSSSSQPLSSQHQTQQPPSIPNPQKSPPPQPSHQVSTPRKPSVENALPRTHMQSLKPDSNDIEAYCTQQRDLHRDEAVRLKRQGLVTEAVACMRNGKHFEGALKALKTGETVDKSQLPPPLHSFTASAVGVESEAYQRSQVVPQMTEEEKKKLYKVPDALKSSEGGSSMLEMLVMRMEKYKEASEQAVKEGNGGKSRRMKRIVKQYEGAIKSTRIGSSYDYTQLPTPPGFPPLQAPPTQPHPANNNTSSQSTSSRQASSPGQGQTGGVNQRQTPPSSSLQRPSSAKSGVQRQASVAHSRAEQQAVFLQQRQMQFKRAAFEAKNSGDMELAKKYMRNAKGFDQMIMASKSGLPVDVSQIPTPPGDDTDFVFVESSDVPVEGDRKTVYDRLHHELINQIKLSETNRDVFTKLGDISSANKFEKMGDNSRKDLDSLKNAYEHNDPVPRFPYETRHFSFVQCNHDLGDNDLEVSIVRAINLNPPSGYSPSDMNVYVKYEFPYPNDNAQCGETQCVKGELNPEFHFSARLETNRKSRSFLRLLKSNRTFKFELYYKRGFFKSDKLLGSAQFKLLPLENKCTYHESFDLMDGRKAVGGKLELKVRIRDPFLSKQVEEKRERWLVIDEFARSEPPRQFHPPTQRSPKTQPSAKQTPSPPSSSSSFHCISVLAWERDQIEQHLQTQATGDVDKLKQRSAALHKKANELKSALHKGGSIGIKDYIGKLKILSQTYTQDAVKAQGNNQATKNALTKKALVHKEIESLSKKLQS